MITRWAILGILLVGGCGGVDVAAPSGGGAGGSSVGSGGAGGSGGSGGSGGGGAGGAGGASTGTADALPLGDCDPAAGVACAGGVACTPAPLAGLAACPTPPTYYDQPGCGPTPHPDGVGTITPTCCTDGDCTEGGAAGRCVYTESVTGCCGTMGQTHCVYDACAKDSDCAADRVCLLAGMRRVEANTCVLAACRSDADCASTPGAECRLLGAGERAALVCVAPDAACRVDADCVAACPTGVCVPVWELVDGVWTLGSGTVCSDSSCLQPA